VQHFKGLIAPAFTPMDSAGEVDLKPIDRLAESLLANDISGAFVCGSTGESVSMTVEERQRLAERWQSVAGDQLPIIVHVGHNALPAAKALAAHAQKIGAAAIAAMAPTFFRPANEAQLVTWCAQIAAAAPELPFYFYHIPSRTRVNVSVTEFLKIGSERIPNLAGAKFTSEDMADLGRALNLEGGRFNLLSGRDEMLLAGFATGAHGAVGTTFNFAAPLYHELIAALDAGDLATAQARQAQSRQMIANLQRYQCLGAFKSVMRLIGLACGSVRLPNLDLTEEQFKTVQSDLEQMGFSDYCSKSA